MHVVNMIGPPCARKSTVAAGLFYLMKSMGLRVELVTEFAKDMVWEGHFRLLDDQLFVFAEQNRRLHRLRDKVDFVITDSPLLLSAIYSPDSYPERFKDLVDDFFKTYENHVFFLHRIGPYSTDGRLQMEHEAEALIPVLRDFLAERSVPYYDIEVPNLDGKLDLSQPAQDFLKAPVQILSMLHNALGDSLIDNPMPQKQTLPPINWSRCSC